MSGSQAKQNQLRILHTGRCVGAILLAFVCGTWAACTVSDLELEGKKCPCLAGWSCVQGFCLANPPSQDSPEEDHVAETLSEIEDQPEIDSVSDTTAELESATSCSGEPTGDLCASVPALTQTPLVDGIASEYCSAQATLFSLATAEHVLATPDAGLSAFNTEVLVNIGWSAVGLHFHVHVQDPNVLPALEAKGTFWWEGDAVEIFAKGDAVLSGKFDGESSDPGAVHVVLSPPGWTATRAALFYGNNYYNPKPLPPTTYAGRIVAGGYELELLLPWSLLRAQEDAGAPSQGGKVAVDIGVDVDDDLAGASGRQVQFFYHLSSEAVADSSVQPCGPLPELHPHCDDRTWCVPTLQGP